MAQTIPDITITTAWQSLNTLSGIAIGTAMQADNKSTALILMSEGTQPAADNVGGVPLTSYAGNKSTRSIEAGSLEIWVRIDADSSTGRITVQGL